MGLCFDVVFHLVKLVGEGLIFFFLSFILSLCNSVLGHLLKDGKECGDSWGLGKHGMRRYNENSCTPRNSRVSLEFSSFFFLILCCHTDL